MCFEVDYLQGNRLLCDPLCLLWIILLLKKYLDWLMSQIKEAQTSLAESSEDKDR